MDEAPEVDRRAGSVRASCPRCRERIEWNVELGRSIMRTLDRLILWVRQEHRCKQSAFVLVGES